MDPSGQISQPPCHLTRLAHPTKCPISNLGSAPHAKHDRIWSTTRGLLRDHPIRPLNQRHKYRRATKLRPIVIQIRLSHPSRAGTRTTSVDLNVLSSHL